MKRIIKFLSIFIFIGLLVSLVSCGKESSNNGGGNNTTPSESGIAEIGDKIVVYDVDYNFDNKNMDEKITSVQNKVVEVGGYVKESSKKKSTATYVYKVPTTKLDILVSYLDTLGGLIDKSIQSHDVTTEYNTLTAALETIDARIAIYREELEKEGVTLDQKLKINDKIDELNAKKLYYQKQYSSVSDSEYSTVTVDYSEKELSGVAKIGRILLRAVLFILIIVLIASPFGLVAFIIFTISKKKIKKIEQ